MKLKLFYLPFFLFLFTPAVAETNKWGIEFVEIPAGSFQMGLNDEWEVVDEMEEPDPDKFNDEKPVHTVVILQAFLLGKTEITQEQWFAIMQTKPGPENNWNASNWEYLPVTGVSWDLAFNFISMINDLDNQYYYRLPTEAEWEYAARAGSSALRPVSLDKLNQHAWYIDNSDDHLHPVAMKNANEWGIHDMLGNLWEWTQDWYAPATYKEGKRVDPTGPHTGKSKVRRGGSYHCPLYQVRPGYRSANPTDTAYSVFGLRVVAVKLN